MGNGFPSVMSLETSTTLVSARESEERASVAGASTETLLPPPPPPACVPTPAPRWSRIPRAATKPPPKRQTNCTGLKEPRPAVPPAWQSTMRAEPRFAGVVPYSGFDPFNEWDVPMVAVADGDHSCLYVGMYRELRDQAELLESTTRFEMDYLGRKYQLSRKLVREVEEQGERALARIRGLSEEVDEKKRRLAELNKASSRRGLRPP